MPELVDVGPSFALQAVDEGIWDPYKPTTWDEIPDNLKDPDGNWVGAYYGIMSIGVNTTLVENVPTSFADLNDPQYAGQVSFNGDPRDRRRGVRRGHGCVARQRRLVRRHHAGHPVLRRPQGGRASCRDRRSRDGDRPVR